MSWRDASSSRKTLSSASNRPVRPLLLLSVGVGDCGLFTSLSWASKGSFSCSMTFVAKCSLPAFRVTNITALMGIRVQGK
jgi:hypothetical protein